MRAKGLLSYFCSRRLFQNRENVFLAERWCLRVTAELAWTQLAVPTVPWKRGLHTGTLSNPSQNKPHSPYSTSGMYSLGVLSTRISAPQPIFQIIINGLRNTIGRSRAFSIIPAPASSIRFFHFIALSLFILTQFLFTVSHSYVTKVSAIILIPFPGGWAEYGLAFRTELLRRNHHSSWFIWLDVLSWVFSEALRSDGRIPVSLLTLHFIDWWELGWCELNWRRMIKEWLKWAGMSW